MVEFMLTNSKYPQELINLADEDGYTPLIHATISENIELMRYLVSQGADVNAMTKNGASAIHYASNDGSVERISFLLDHGANLQCQSIVGTPLHWAAGQQRCEAIRYLISRGADINASGKSPPPIFLAAASQSDEAVSIFLNTEGIDISIARNKDLNLLHMCAEFGLSQSVQRILEFEEGRAFAVMPTKDGNLPIHLASMSQHREVVEMLKPMSGEPWSGMDVEELLQDGQQRLEEWHKNHANDTQPVNTRPAGGEDVEAMVAGLACQPAESREAELAAEAMKSQGNECFLAKDYHAAISAYSEAIKLQGNNHILWSNRSACYLLIKEPRNALIDAMMCRRLKPDWPKGAYRVAAARMALGMYEDAAVAAFEGCKLDENNEELKKILKEAVAKGREEHLSKSAGSRS